MPTDAVNNLILRVGNRVDANTIARRLIIHQISFTARPLLPSDTWEIEILQPVSVDLLRSMSHLTTP